MTARQWLGRARYIKHQISVLEKAKKETHDSVTRITQNYDSDGAQSTKNPHKFDRLVEFDNEIDNKLNELNETLAEIQNKINRLNDQRLEMVLVSYYVRMMTLERIAIELNYSYPHVKRLKREGERKIENMMLE